MIKPIIKIIEEAASADDHPKKHLVSLLPILEHQYTAEVASELRIGNVDSNSLIRFAVGECLDYWQGLALQWLLAGHPIDRTMATELEAFGRSHSGTQHDRHIAFRLAVRWKNTSAVNTGVGQTSKK
jgi:hypothetical protein